MNNYYNIDSFEQFLRDKTKDFKMMPKKRLWFSIYNNIHPSKSFPSSITSIFLLFIFFFIDFLNTKYQINPSSKTEINNTINSSLFLVNNAPLDNRRLFSLATKTKKEIVHHNEVKKNKRKNSVPFEKEIKFEFEECEGVKTEQNKTTSNLILIKNHKYENKINLNSIDNFVHNKKSNSSNLSYEIYASPSITFSNMKEGNSISIIDEENEGSKNNKQNFRYSDVNLYAGGAILYNVNSSIRIKAGLELRYTKSSFSPLSNNSSINNFNKNKIERSEFLFFNNYQNSLLELNSYNISLPIGSEFELAGNDRIHWYAGASIEPTVKIYDNPVLNNSSELSIYEHIKSRKWNLNSNFETYLSLRINKNSFFNAGPQFRYQLFSRYNNLINPYNNSYNFGMKFGISKSF